MKNVSADVITISSVNRTVLMCEKKYTKNVLPTIAITMSEHLVYGFLVLVRNKLANRSSSGTVYLYIKGGIHDTAVVRTWPLHNDPFYPRNVARLKCV